MISAQTSESVAYQRGYRTGLFGRIHVGLSRYASTVLRKSYTRHADYKKADRAYYKDYGQIEDYRDGYQQGFESGYETGYEREIVRIRPAVEPSEARHLVASDNRLQRK